jgi:hypothetical protein
VNLNDALLELADSKLNATWAIAIADHVLPLFTAVYPDDHKPAQCLTAAKNYLADPTRSNRRAVEKAAKQINSSTRRAADEGESAFDAELYELAASIETAMAAATAVIRAAQTTLKSTDSNTADAGYTSQWAQITAIRSCTSPQGLTAVAERAAIQETHWQVASLLTLAYPDLDPTLLATTAVLFTEFDGTLSDLVAVTTAACHSAPPAVVPPPPTLVSAPTL